jgi:hypothetical protein
MVVSCWFWFDPSEAALEDPNNATFGKLVTDLSSARRKVSDIRTIVCHRYCEIRTSTIIQAVGDWKITIEFKKEAYDIACDYYWTKFDTAHWDRKYELAWGQDGYALGNLCSSTGRSMHQKQ